MYSCIVQRRITKYTGGGGIQSGSNIGIIAISEVYEVSVAVYFAPELQCTQSPNITIGQVETEERSRNIYFV
jgi:hypothetical protein